MSNVPYGPLIGKLNLEWFYKTVKKQGIKRFRFMTYTKKKYFEKLINEYFIEYLWYKLWYHHSDELDHHYDIYKSVKEYLYAQAEGICKHTGIEIIYNDEYEYECNCKVESDDEYDCSCEDSDSDSDDDNEWKFVITAVMDSDSDSDDE